VTLIRTLVAAGGIGLCAVCAQAQTYPSRPITIVVTLAAGGAGDLIARATAQRLAEEWGQPVVIENRAGANTQLGANYVAKSAPDGYTLLLTAEHTFTVNPYLYRKLPYDPVRDFTPVSGLAAITQALVVHPSAPMQSVADLVALAKARPGELNYGSFGVGSGPHLSMELLQAMAGVKLTAVQYRGAAAALADIIAGHIPMMFVSFGLVVEPWTAGRVRLLGIGSGERLARFPNLPAVDETVPGFRSTVWFGLFAPGGTPPDIVAKINATVQQILAGQPFADKILTANYYKPMTGSPEQFAEFIAQEAGRWRKVISDAKITIDE
jgi:tripartite-type tricarboxylate transporter receptor subunit TctC